MFWTVFVLVSCIKTLYIPSYKSTDFEVHRNWLAITSSLPYNKWYTENTSEWTLDYPPYFAWFEFILSKIAVYFDPEMLKVHNLNYSSWMTIMFQRLSVIVTDLVLALGIKSCADSLPSLLGSKAEKYTGDFSKANIVAILLLSNTGLFLVDHIHFQYNGFLSGILLLSIGALGTGNFMLASVWFSVLLNLKHIYLYYAPAYGIYMLRSYCFKSTQDGRIIWSSFSFVHLVSLGTAVLANVAISFGPFLQSGQLEQVLSRLFPFKRGLCHAYWAPNTWAVYNMVDKVLVVAGKRLGMLDTSTTVASMTGGLVQDITHTVLPNISPMATAIITLVSMLPALVKLWISPNSVTMFLRCLVLCAWSSFLFGWHVHEKAVLLIILPLAILALGSRQEAKFYLITSATGHFSLFPLLFGPLELPSKLFLHLAHTLLSFRILPTTTCKLEKLFIFLSIPVFLWAEVIHSAAGLDTKLPFLPLLLYSLYGSIGIISTYLRMYWQFMKA